MRDETIGPVFRPLARPPVRPFRGSRCETSGLMPDAIGSPANRSPRKTNTKGKVPDLSSRIVRLIETLHDWPSIDNDRCRFDLIPKRQRPRKVKTFVLDNVPWGIICLRVIDGARPISHPTHHWAELRFRAGVDKKLNSFRDRFSGPTYIVARETLPVDPCLTNTSHRDETLM